MGGAFLEGRSAASAQPAVRAIAATEVKILAAMSFLFSRKTGFSGY
jgi:hypothetical protein